MRCAWLTLQASACVRAPGGSRFWGSTPGTLWPSELGSLLGCLCSLIHPWSHSLGLPLDWGFSLALHGLNPYPLPSASGLWCHREPVVGEDTEAGVQLPSGGVGARDSVLSRLCSILHKLSPNSLGSFLASFPPPQPHPNKTRGKGKDWDL